MKILKCTTRSLLIIVLALFTFTASAEIAVIVNPSNASNLTKKDIKRIFLGKMKKFPGGGSVIAVNLSSGDSTRDNFEKNVVGKSASQMKAYWSKLVFSGKGNPPKEATNATEALDLVAKNPAVIGYVDASAVTDKVKVVGKF